MAQSRDQKLAYDRERMRKWRKAHPELKRAENRRYWRERRRERERIKYRIKRERERMPLLHYKADPAQGELFKRDEVVGTRSCPASDEQWIVLRDHPDYEISDRGRVRHKTKLRLLIGSQTNEGYIVIGLSKPGVVKRSYYLLHRLVAITFLGLPIDGKLIVNHMDGNKANNKVGNLQWVTPAMNTKHWARTGRRRGRQRRRPQ